MSQALEETRTDLDQVQAGQETEAPPTPAEGTSTPAEPGPPDQDATTPDVAETIKGHLNSMQEAFTTRQRELERQLARLEGRHDRGGEDAAAVKELRKEQREIKESVERLGDLRTGLSKLDALDELRESAVRHDDLAPLVRGLTILMKRTLEPEEFAAVDKEIADARSAAERRRSDEKTARERSALEARAAKAEAERKALEERISKGETPTAEPAPPSADPEVDWAAAELDKRIRKAHYDPNDREFAGRLLALAGDVTKLPNASARLDALLDALDEVKKQDAEARAEAERKQAEEAARKRSAEKEAEKRSAARTAVQTDRTRAGSTAHTYTTQRELEQAFNNNEIDAETFKKLLPSLPY